MAAFTPTPSIISFTELANSLSELHQAHAHMVKTGIFHQPYAASRLLSFSTLFPSISNPQTLNYAYSVFNRIPNPNSYLWNTIIRSFANSSSPEKSILVFHQMLHSSFTPDKFTYPFVLKACSFSGKIDEGEQIHAQILKTGFGSDVFVQNSLINLYAKVGDFDIARMLLDKMLQSDVISWNAILSGLTERSLMEKAHQLFDEMPERNVESWNFMISGYVSVGLVEEARCLFDEMPLRDVASWNAMIVGYMLLNEFTQVLKLFKDMQILKVKPDNCTLVYVLSACTQVGNLEQGEYIHAYIDKNEIKVHGSLATTLVDMYSKCGCIEKALRVFYDTKTRDVSTWNSIIAGLSIHGYGKDALGKYYEMINDGCNPNEITFLCILSACCRCGLLDEGRSIYKFMTGHGIRPSIEHYGCIVDLLSRAGCLNEMEELVKSMPLNEKALDVWESLLSACKRDGNGELAKLVAEKISNLNPTDS